MSTKHIVFLIAFLLEWKVANGKGFVQSLVLEIRNNWMENDILTVEKAINFMKEQDIKKINESPER